MRAFVLTYHSGNISGNDYPSNDLIALAHDLEAIHALRLPILPLRRIVDALLEGTTATLPEKAVALTLDDGLDFDFVELTHPFHGPQSSARSVLRRFAHAHAAPIHATTFVIASPRAREQIARHEMLDHQWIGEHWWAEAIASGVFHVANHSWDHLSPSVSPVGQREGRSGAFTLVTTFDDAELQVRRAREYIAGRAPNAGTALFAYPYGDASPYMVEEYLPLHGERGGTLAAFTGIPGVLHETSNRWYLPRYCRGTDWKSPEELTRILAGS
jgi:peptidoglycan/xylan/chitin deacetylase (PgdA/CDA1 family)